MAKLTSNLRTQYLEAKKNGDDLESASWGYMEGVVITVNEAKEIVEALNSAKKALSGLINGSAKEFADIYGFGPQREEAVLVLKKLKKL